MGEVTSEVMPVIIVFVVISWAMTKLIEAIQNKKDK